MALPRTVKQAVWYASARLMAKAIAFVAFILFAREVGASHFGVYTYLVSVVALLQPFSNLGMLGEVYRRSKSATLKFLGDFFFTALLLNFLFSLVVGLIVALRGYSPVLVLLSMLVFLSRNLLDYINKVHMVWGRVRFLSIGGVAEKLVFSIMVLLLPKKTVFFLTSLIVSQVVTFTYLKLKLGLITKPELTLSYFSWPFLLTAVAIAAASRLPVLVYDWRFGVQTLGNFGAAAFIYQAFSLILIDIKTFLNARAGKFGDKQWEKLKKLTLAASILGMVFIIPSREVIVWLVNSVFGVSYENAGILFFYQLLALPSALLLYYPTSKLLYNSPKRYFSMFFAYMIISVAFSLVAPTIEAAVLLRVLASYIQVGLGYLLASQAQRQKV